MVWLNFCQYYSGVNLGVTGTGAGFNLISYEPGSTLALVVTVTTFLLGDNVLEYSALFHPGFIAPYYLTYSLFIPLILLILAYIKYGRPPDPIHQSIRN